MTWRIFMRNGNLLERKTWGTYIMNGTRLAKKNDLAMKVMVAFAIAKIVTDEIHIGHSIFCAGTCVCICIRLGDGGTSDLYRDGHVYHLYGYVPYPCDMWRINTRHSG